MNTQRKDSIIYRVIFEYIKENGILPLTKFCASIDRISHNKTEDLFYDYVFRNKNWFLEILEENKEVIELLKQFNNGFLNWMPLFSKEFSDFIFDINKKCENIDLFLQNAKKLEELDIDIIKLANPRTIQFYEDYNQYLYSNGRKYDINKRVMFDNCNWVLIDKKIDEEQNFRSIVINGFDSDLSLLPSKKSLSRKRI